MRGIVSTVAMVAVAVALTSFVADFLSARSRAAAHAAEPYQPPQVSTQSFR